MDPYTSNDGEDEPVLTASTGKNDSNSIWNSGGLFTSIGALGTTAGSIYKAFGGAPAAKKAKTNYTPFIIAGAVALLLVFGLALFGRK